MVIRRYRAPPPPARGRAARLPGDEERCLGPGHGVLRFGEGGYVRPAHFELDDDAARDPELSAPRGWPVDVEDE